MPHTTHSVPSAASPYATHRILCTVPYYIPTPLRPILCSRSPHPIPYHIMHTLSYSPNSPHSLYWYRLLRTPLAYRPPAPIPYPASPSPPSVLALTPAWPWLGSPAQGHVRHIGKQLKITIKNNKKENSNPLGKVNNVFRYSHRCALGGRECGQELACIACCPVKQDG